MIDGLDRHLQMFECKRSEHRAWRHSGWTFAIAVTLGAVSHACAAQSVSARQYLDCAAYFFMAANAKPMTEFDDYYRSGEYAYNRALMQVGEDNAMQRFNSATRELNTLIEKKWTLFKKADDRYGVVCADIKRAATHPDRNH